MSLISSRDNVWHTIEEVLKRKHFCVTPILVEGVLNIVNQIADYHEEGIRYYPEVILLSDISYLESLQGRWYELYRGKLELVEFSRLMKLCAPLAVNNWSIFIISNERNMSYGVVSAEIKEYSLSLYSQMIEVTEADDPILYIRNIGGKNVELRSNNDSEIIAMTLDELTYDIDENVNKLANAIIQECPELYKSDKLLPFVKKIIKEALNEGHGNLIVVCEEQQLQDVIKEMTGGALLDRPIPIPELLFQDVNDNTNKSSVAIKSNVSLIKSMINHDGITIFSTKGSLLGYHYIVNNQTDKTNSSIGGARTRAFDKLAEMDCLVARFFKSQDGKTKFV